MIRDEALYARHSQTLMPSPPFKILAEAHLHHRNAHSRAALMPRCRAERDLNPISPYFYPVAQDPIPSDGFQHRCEVSKATTSLDELILGRPIRKTLDPRSQSHIAYRQELIKVSPGALSPLSAQHMILLVIRPHDFPP